MLSVCPICGGSLSNNQCVKCGYKPVKQDEDAFARWREHILMSQEQVQRTGNDVRETGRTANHKNSKKNSGGTVRNMGPNRLFLVVYVIVVLIWGACSMSEAADAVVNKKYREDNTLGHDITEQTPDDNANENGRNYEDDVNFDF